MTPDRARLYDAAHMNATTSVAELQRPIRTYDGSHPKVDLGREAKAEVHEALRLAFEAGAAYMRGRAFVRGRAYSSLARPMAGEDGASLRLWAADLIQQMGDGT